MGIMYIAYFDLNGYACMIDFRGFADRNMRYYNNPNNPRARA